MHHAPRGTNLLIIALNNSPRLAENSHLLKPPVNNYCVYNEDFTVMVRTIFFTLLF